MITVLVTCVALALWAGAYLLWRELVDGDPR